MITARASASPERENPFYVNAIACFPWPRRAVMFSDLRIHDWYLRVKIPICNTDLVTAKPKQTTVRLPDNLWLKLKRLALERRVSAQQIIIELLESSKGGK